MIDVVETVQMPLDQLEAAEYNPRRDLQPGDKEYRDIERSLKRWGLVEPLVWNKRSGRLVGGHQRLKVLRAEGLERAPVTVVDLDDTEEAALNVALNKIAGEWDMPKLQDVFGGLEDFDATLTGFDDDELAQVLRWSAENTTTEDIPPAVPKTAQSIDGEIYELGPHRIACVDSTDLDGLGALDLLASPIDVVVTDPPYAIYGSSSGVSASITDDKIVRPFFLTVCQLARRFLKKFGHAYIFCDWRSWASWWEMAKRAELTTKNCLVWDKGSFGMGSNYANTYELIGFYANLPPQRVMTSDMEGGQRQVLGKPNIIHHTRAQGKERQHNAAKPVGLLAHLIANSTDKGEVVLDPFLGSGSTLIAAEQCGRVCYGVEIDPAYCDVIRQRYANFVKDPAFSPIGELT